MLGLESSDNLYTSKHFHDVRSDTKISSNKGYCEQSLNSSNGTTDINDVDGAQWNKINSLPFPSDFSSSEYQPCKDAVQNLVHSAVCARDCRQPPLKFQTAGGKSLSISSDALKRAQSLLGDSDVESSQNVVGLHQPVLLVKEEKISKDVSWNKENILYDSSLQNADAKTLPPKIVPAIPAFTNRLKTSSLSATNARVVHLGHVKANDFSAKRDHHANRNMSYLQEPSKKISYIAQRACDKSRDLTDCPRSVGPLVEISDNIFPNRPNRNELSSEKKRPKRRISISPFKRPRISRFVLLPFHYVNIALSHTSGFLSLSLAQVHHSSEQQCLLLEYW